VRVCQHDDAVVTPALFASLPAEVRYILGDTHYNTPDAQENCQGLVASRHEQCCSINS
jgi:hypothetical protein